MSYYLREAWRKIYREYPSSDSLAILWAQTVLETGGGEFLKNWNWGNIKRRSGIKYTSYYCSEVINGVNRKFYPYHPETFFAAWESALDGAVGYITFLSSRGRYAEAWKRLQEGKPGEYVYWLKQGGYFTAPLSHYTRVVIKLFNEFKAKEEELLSWRPPEPEPEPDPELEPALVIVIGNRVVHRTAPDLGVGIVIAPEDDDEPPNDWPLVRWPGGGGGFYDPSFLSVVNLIQNDEGPVEQSKNSTEKKEKNQNFVYLILLYIIALLKKLFGK
jgi:hypothetical protein